MLIIPCRQATNVHVPMSKASDISCCLSGTIQQLAALQPFHVFCILVSMGRRGIVRICSRDLISILMKPLWLQKH